MAVCLIAGGAGFLGSHLAEALLARGDTVRVVDNFSHGSPTNLAAVGSQVEVIPGRPAVPRAGPPCHGRGGSGVPHGRPVAGEHRSARSTRPRSGAVGTWHLLLAARDAGCRRGRSGVGRRGVRPGRAGPRHRGRPRPTPATPAGKGRPAGRAGGRLVRPVVRDRPGPVAVLQRVRSATGPAGARARTSAASWRRWPPAPGRSCTTTNSSRPICCTSKTRPGLSVGRRRGPDGRSGVPHRSRPTGPGRRRCGPIERAARDGPPAGPGRPMLDRPAGGPCRTSPGPGSNSGSRLTSTWTRGCGGAWKPSGPMAHRGGHQLRSTICAAD